MENAQNLMYFVQNRIMSDYVGFEGATDTYYEKAEHMDSVMAVFNDNISALHKVMAEMNNGITNISTVVEENASFSENLGSDSGKDGKHEKKNCVSCRCNQF